MRPQSRGGKGEGHPCLPCDTHYGHRRPTPSFFLCAPGRRRLYRTETDEQQHEEKVETRETRTAAVTDCELPMHARSLSHYKHTTHRRDVQGWMRGGYIPGRQSLTCCHR